MRTRTLTFAAVILAALPTLALAQTRPAPVLDFAAADTDGDGAISRQEWTTYSGSLVQGMRAEGLAMRADALLAAGDSDGDGALNRDELVAALTAQAGQRGERMRGPRGDDMAQMRRQGRHTHDGHGGRHGDMRREGRGPMGGEMRGDMRGEWGADMGARGFARIDADGNGSLSPEELAQAQEFLNWMAQRPRRN